VRGGQEGERRKILWQPCELGVWLEETQERREKLLSLMPAINIFLREARHCQSKEFLSWLASKIPS